MDNVKLSVNQIIEAIKMLTTTEYKEFVCMMAIAFLMLVYVTVSLIIGHVIAGWASLMLSVWFIGAILTMGGWIDWYIYREDVFGNKAETHV